LAQTRTLFAGIALAALSATTMVNAVFWQDGRHPAPFAETRSFLSPKPHKSATRRNAPDAIAERIHSDSMGALSASERQVLVSGVQEALSERGFYTGSIDGLYGPKTESAIKQFEREAGLQVTGRPSPDLLGQIKYRDMRPGASRQG